MKRKIIVGAVLLAAGAFTTFSIVQHDNPGPQTEACCEMEATCYGKDPCNACKNCKYCKRCSQNGGSCGVCK